MPLSLPQLQSLFQQAQQFHQSGNLGEANRLLGQLLKAEAEGAPAATFQAEVWGNLGRPADALASAEKALALDPAFVEAHFIRGESLRALGRLEEALESFGRALSHAPDLEAALTNRAAVLLGLERNEAALADYDHLLRLLPNDPDVLTDRAQALGALFRFAEALESTDRALAIEPRNAKAWHNRGIVLWNMERFAEALAAYDQALAIQPDLAPTQSSRANVLQDMKRLDEARAAHDRVVARWPDFVSGRWNRSQCLLLQGEWRDGFAEFEWRKRRAQSARLYPKRAHPEWRGDAALTGKTLLIRAEQGLGDTLQFARFCAPARARGAKIICAVQRPLLALLRGGLVGADQVIALDDPAPSHDFHIAMMSMALAFGTHLGDGPADIPYIRADADLAAQWRARLGSRGFKIGICWRGAGLAGTDVGRSYPVAALAPVAALPGVRLISLQKGEAALAQLASLPAGMRVETLADFDQGPGAFVDTAAVMDGLDLVISSDTSVAHLAGAMGRPVWLATRHVPDWRWQLDRSDSPWYPSMRLFRQKASGDWASVFSEMADAVRGMPMP